MISQVCYLASMCTAVRNLAAACRAALAISLQFPASLPCPSPPQCPSRVHCAAAAAALLALMVEVDAATSLVSFGTLVSLWMVCNAQLYRRYCSDIQLRFTRCGRHCGMVRCGGRHARTHGRLAVWMSGFETGT